MEAGSGDRREWPALKARWELFSAPDQTGEFVSSGALPAILALILSAANMLWTWHAKNQSAAADKVKKIEDDQDALANRVLKLETDFKHLPSKEDLSKLSLQVERVFGMVSKQESEITAVARTVNRIDDYLREKA